MLFQVFINNRICEFQGILNGISSCAGVLSPPGPPVNPQQAAQNCASQAQASASAVTMAVAAFGALSPFYLMLLDTYPPCLLDLIGMTLVLRQACLV